MRFHHVSSKQTKITQKTTYRATIFLIAGVFAVTAIGGALMSRKITSADSFDDQIAAQQKTADSAGDKLAQALASAGSYDVAVKNLQSQQNDLEAQIGASNAKINNLNAQIAATQQQIRDASVALAKTSATIYAKQQSSGTLDILMNSRSVSDYVDALSQQDALKNQMTSSIKNIGELKEQLQKKKNQSSDLLKQQQVKHNQIAENQSQQQQLLNQANGDASAQQATISAAKSKIAELQKEQAAKLAEANSRYRGASVGGSTDYPFANVPGFRPDGCLLKAFPFGGGTCARQCASYVEWEVYVKTGTRATASGNAKQWWNTWSNIRSSTPRVNSAVVWGIGGFGHIAWVEEVKSSDDIVISQYNADYKGSFSRVEVNPHKYMSDLKGYLYF